MSALLAVSIGSASTAPSALAAAPNPALIRSIAGSTAEQPLGLVRLVSYVVPTAAAPHTAAAARAARMARFTQFTLRSAATRDLRGVEGSLYRGAFYRPSMERFRQCVATRESEGHYDVVSSSGSYFGAYQVSRALARGATWMMLREHRRLMGAHEASVVLARLRATPMNRWPRYWQDAAFSTIVNWEHTGSGARHWAGGRWHC